MKKPPAAFLSYVRFDDEHETGRLSKFRERLSGEIRLQTGEEFPIFQDREDISWGQAWKARIEESIDAVTFLLPILTPGFFRSDACRAELERFLEREKQRGRSDLILPVYYVKCPVLDDPAKRAGDALAGLLAQRQYADWRELRFEPFTAPHLQRTLAKMAEQVVEALDRPVEAPPSKRSRPAESLVSAIETTNLALPAEPTGVVAKSEPPTRIVDALHRGHHTTLMEAIQAAKAGDRILVRPGLYRESIVIDKPLEIIGDGELGEVVIATTDENSVLFKTTMGRLVNLTIRKQGAGFGFGVDIHQGRLEIEGCDISTRNLACVAIRTGADPRLRRNRIHGSSDVGVYVSDRGLGAIEDNEIFGTGMGVLITGGGHPTVRRNRISRNARGVRIADRGGGVFENNDLRGNADGAWDIAEDCLPNVLRSGNLES